MCGLAGLVDTTSDPNRLRGRIAAMTVRVAHRGPDGEGFWIDEGAGCALGHRRLAIIDLSDAGAQPMLSANGRFVLVFNGEIYNYRALGTQLQQRGVQLCSASDTEALLECWSHLGPEQTLAMLDGMFAFAVWDRETRTITLVRDRIGVKPLLWSLHDGAFRFGSDLRAISADLGVAASPDLAALDLYVRYGFVPAPLSIDPRVRKLEPGAMLTWSAGGAPRVKSYWSVGDVMRASTLKRTDVGGDALIDALDTRISAAVSKQMVSDVPVGAFLSGGVDSSLIVAIMRKLGPVRTFTIGFDDPALDESPHAAAVAASLGTEHTAIPIRAADALALAETVSDLYDEPFADASQIPTALLCRVVREEVKVVLSGDGGDEGFGGYARYNWVGGLARYRAAPRALRTAVAGALSAAPAAALDALTTFFPGRPALHPGQKLRRMALVGASIDHRAAYARFLQLSTEHRFVHADAAPSAFEAESWSAVSDPLDQMQLADLRFYLPDDVLTKVDRASMAVGLEVRVPLLDHNLLAFALSIPPQQRRNKAPLRALLARYVPRDIIDRPKAGFGVPMAAWLRGPLRDWANERLHAPMLDGVDAVVVRKAWALHLSGAEDHAPVLWALIMLQQWRTAQGSAL